MVDVPPTESLQVRMHHARSLPDTLAASFDAFEVIRILARQFQDQVPQLFAAFMTTADAAVDGREAITIAPHFRHPAKVRVDSSGWSQAWNSMRSSLPWPRSGRY